MVEVGKPIVSFEVDDAGSSNGGAAHLLLLRSLPGRGPQVTVPPSRHLPMVPPPLPPMGWGSPAKREPNLVGYGAVVEHSGRPTRRARVQVQNMKAAAPEAPATADPVVPRQAEAETSERPRSTPSGPEARP